LLNRNISSTGLETEGCEFGSRYDGTWHEFKKIHKVFLTKHLVRQEYVVPDFNEKPLLSFLFPPLRHCSRAIRAITIPSALLLQSVSLCVRSKYLSSQGRMPQTKGSLSASTSGLGMQQTALEVLYGYNYDMGRVAGLAGTT
jgi:hypothetical protein